MFSRVCVLFVGKLCRSRMFPPPKKCIFPHWSTSPDLRMTLCTGIPTFRLCFFPLASSNLGVGLTFEPSSVGQRQERKTTESPFFVLQVFIAQESRAERRGVSRRRGSPGPLEEKDGVKIF